MDDVELPPIYDYYLITFPLENINIPWLERQRQKVNGKFIVVYPGKNYNYHLDNTVFINYLEWHLHFDMMQNWHGVMQVNDKKKYKFSAICNRVTQSKIWIATKLLKCNSSESLIYTNNWIEDKNVHNWQLTGNATLDDLTLEYKSKYIDRKINDGFTQTDNQQFNSNPWHDIYSSTAIHFVLSSFHYSFTVNPDNSNFICPGPDIDEKILKCLLAGTPFIACGQFDIYGHLSAIGFEFEYNIDLNFDKDPGNLSRFESIVNLVDQIDLLSIEDIVETTKKSSLNNRNYILKKGLHNACEKNNKTAVEQILHEINFK
jgi:hypothetical protein